MKLIIQIPCYNEAQTLPITVAARHNQPKRTPRVLGMPYDSGEAIMMFGLRY